MRALVCFLVLAAAAPVYAQPSVVTDYGASPDAIAAALQGDGRKVTQSCPVPWNVRNPQVLVETTATKDGLFQKVRYVFSDKGLIGVLEAVTPTDAAATIDLHCAALELELSTMTLTPADGTPDQSFPTAPNETTRLVKQDRVCERWRTTKEFADNKYKIVGWPTQCFEPLRLDERNRDTLGPKTSCTSTEERYFDLRTLRIEKESDLHFELSIDKPGSIELARSNGETIEKADAKKGVWHEARLHQKLAPGCYLVQIAAQEPKTSTEYRLDIEPYADWKANDDLEREEQLGEEPDEGPPTAEYPAILVGGAQQYYGGTTHLNVAAVVGLVDAGNMYGMNTQIGFEVTKHPRVRGIVGGSIGVTYQMLDDMWSTTNTMLPVSLWGGVRANALPKLLVQARLGLLGYYISADADEKMLGAYDRSETGSGYVFGLDMMYGPLVLGLEQMFLGEGVTTFRLGFGF